MKHIVNPLTADSQYEKKDSPAQLVDILESCQCCTDIPSLLLQLTANTVSCKQKMFPDLDRKPDHGFGDMNEFRSRIGDVKCQTYNNFLK